MSEEDRRSAESAEESSEDPTFCLQSLPPVILDSIFKHLTYSCLVKLRHLSTSFHRAVVHKFRVGFASLLPNISKVLSNIEAQILTDAHQLNDQDSAKALIALCSKYSFVKVVYSEAKFVRAICQRHVDRGVWNYISAYTPFLLDHFNVIISYYSYRYGDDSAESAMTSELLFLTSQHVEHFTQKVEPTLDFSLPFQVKLADILDCAQDCLFSSTLVEWEESYSLHSTYLIRAMSSIDFPWDVFEDIPVEEKLEYMLKSIKNNVRFTNYINSLRDTWSLEEILVRRGYLGLKQYFAGPNHYHRAADGSEEPCWLIHHLKEWRRLDESTKISDEIYRSSGCAESYCLEVTLVLEGGPRPLNLPQDTEDEDRGSFDLHIYIQYPSREDLRLNKSCLRATGKAGVCTLKSHNHHRER